MNLNNEILKLTCELYDKYNFSRSGVQVILEKFENFITNVYNPLLLQEINASLHNAVSNQVSNVINNIFEKYENPFHRYNSEDKRLHLYKKMGLYDEPQTCILKEEKVPKCDGNKVYLISKSKTMVHISLKKSLIKIFQMDGLLNATLSYMNRLHSEISISSNFIQGSLWKNQKTKYDKSAIVMPILTYFDDLETGNALGSHAGKNQIGCVYSTIPCFPPNFSSKLESILVTDLFYSSDRKEFGNKVVFQTLISELQDIQTQGIEIIVKGIKYKIYFVPSLVLGDNLGLNGILGFVESFALTHYCRICYCEPNEMKIMTKENTIKLRSKEKYETEAKSLNCSEAGVKEICVFNALNSFHVIDNSSVDVMHDVFEGVANYVMAQILLKLILEDDLFSIHFLNNALNTIDFGFESSNVPLDISLDYVKTNKRLKMSASETLFLTRYFGLMVGDMVPKENKTWPLYTKLRQIIDIVTSTNITNSHLLQLEILIEEHHALYIKLFGTLKAKFNFLLHYVRLMKQNGPLINISSMRYESKHTEIKAILNATASKRNVLQSVGIRLQLSLMHFQFSRYQDLYIKYGKELTDTTVNIHFSTSNSRRTFSHVTINDVTYKNGTVIVAEILKNGPIFGKIEKIYDVDNSIFFEYIPFQLIGFNMHLFAFSAVPTETTKKIIKHCSIALRTPCLLHKKEEISYIYTRHIL